MNSTLTQIKQPSQRLKIIPSDVTNRMAPDKSQVLQGSVEDLEKLQKEAEESADVLMAAVKRCAEEYTACTARTESSLARSGLNEPELRERAKSAASTAASVQQAGLDDGLEAEIRFVEEVLKATAVSKAERALTSEIRRVRKRSSRLEVDIATLEHARREATPLEILDSCKVKEWQAEAAHCDEKAKILRKRIDALKVPSQSDLQKRYNEVVELKAKVSAEQKYLQRFDGLPPSLVESSRKLSEANQELAELKAKLRNDYQLNY